ALRRGLLTAIEAITLLNQKIPNIKLVIVGKSTTDYILKEKVKSLGLENYVIFEGWQDVLKFPSYIISSSICLSPLERSLQHDVAYANKLFQYMSFGKPLLVSNAIAQKELVEKVQAGLVHKEKNPQDFADKVLQLYKSEKLREKLGENGKNFVQNEFNWSVTGKNLIDLYKNLET
ncbi:MAG: glycosyltransferase family 4 protein, partial [Lutibacter sp.]